MSGHDVTTGGAVDSLAPSLAAALAQTPRVAVALSGGVDSVTLMAFAHRLHGDAVAAFHAVSPAVPPSSTERVRALAARFGWPLTVLDAGETADPEYLRNPLDRCRVCKSHLYDAIAAIGVATSAQVVSGTNLDDLGDFRPGLEAARARGVRHPFVEAGIDKAGVRALARALGLHDTADLPAQPCLASRVETGIAIDAALLVAVNAVEDAVRAQLGATTVVRCRVRRGVGGARVAVIELGALGNLDEAKRRAIVDATAPLVGAAGLGVPELAPYRMGSAFLHVL